MPLASQTRTAPSGGDIVMSEVLIVDDDLDIRELLAEFFRSKGLIVSVAADGRGAVSAIEREPARYGLILTDLQLPGCDGLHVLEAAKRANPSLCVVIITGFASLDSAIQAVRLGAYDYLTKPFSLGQIEVLLARVRERLSLEAENRRLLHRLVKRDDRDLRSPVLVRLEAIETRLAGIEAAIARPEP